MLDLHAANTLQTGILIIFSQVLWNGYIWLYYLKETAEILIGAVI